MLDSNNAMSTLDSIQVYGGNTTRFDFACKDAAKKLINLGLIFTPVEDAIRDTVASLKEKGFLVQKISQS